MLTTTEVAELGAGVTVPETVIVADPEYEGWSVETVTVVCANAAVGPRTNRTASMAVARVGSVFMSITEC